MQDDLCSSNVATSLTDDCWYNAALHGENDKLLLAARKVRRAARTSFVISLVPDDFSHSSSTYVGKIEARSNSNLNRLWMKDYF